MSDFTAKLRVAGESADPVAANVAVQSGRLTVSIGDTEVASWPVADVTVTEGRGKVDLTAGEESFTLDVTDPYALVERLRDEQETLEPPKKRRIRMPARPSADRDRSEKRPADTEPGEEGRRSRGNTIAVVGGFLALGAITVAALLWPLVTGPIGLLIGLLAVTVGYLAYTEPTVALRLPSGVSAMFLIITGAGIVVIGAGVTLLG